MNFPESLGTQLLQLLFGLDAFRKCRCIEAGADPDHRPDDGKVTRIRFDTGDEAAVELDLVECKSAEIAEGGITGAEIVNSDADAEFLQSPQQRQALFDVGKEDRLGDLDLQTLGAKAGFIERGNDCREQAVMPELTDREIDSNPQMIGPSRRCAAGFEQYPLTDMNNEPGFLGERYEFHRRDQPPLGMAPSDQRLEARQAVVIKLHYRLVVKFELSLLQRLVQLGRQHVTSLGFKPHFRQIETVGRASALLRSIKRKVCVPHQHIVILGMLGRQRNTDAAGNVLADTLKLEGN